MKENNLKGFEVIGQEVEELTDMLKCAEGILESIKTAIGTIVGDPLKLSYGYCQSLGNGQAYKTEIAMSRECTLSEALFVLSHCYGVDPKTISVKGRRIGEGHSAKVKSIEVIESWGSKEYVITVEREERE